MVGLCQRIEKEDLLLCYPVTLHPWSTIHISPLLVHLYPKGLGGSCHALLGRLFIFGPCNFVWHTGMRKGAFNMLWCFDMLGQNGWYITCCMFSSNTNCWTLKITCQHDYDFTFLFSVLGSWCLGTWVHLDKVLHFVCFPFKAIDIFIACRLIFCGWKILICIFSFSFWV